ncbi:MAG: hypothetical protein R2804_08800 [Cyclobacteriaceae bacterium]
MTARWLKLGPPTLAGAGASEVQLQIWPDWYFSQLGYLDTSLASHGANA